MQDVRYALRMLRRTPVFTAVTIVTLALAIGANTAIFSVLDALMFRDLPVTDPDRLVEVFSEYPGERRRNGFGRPFYEHYRDHNQVFTDLFAFFPGRFDVRGDTRDASAEPVLGEYVSGNFFTGLGVQAARGRLISPQDDRPGQQSAVAVLSWSYWQRRFSGSPSVIGSDIVINGQSVTVIGVTPPEFFGVRVGLRPGLWVPIALAEKLPFVAVLGRLKPGVSIERASADMRVLDQWRVSELSRNSRDPQWLRVQILLEPAAAGASQLRDQFANQVLILMALVVVLLLMACTTIASMLLARGASRRGELAIRVALGASRSRMARQVVTEAAVLVTTGALLGIGLAVPAAQALVRSWRPDVRSGWISPTVDMTVGLDARVLLFTSIVALLTALLFGLPAAWTAFATAPASTLRGAHGHVRTGLRRVFGRSFVVAQVAVSLVLATAAALFVGHLVDLRSPERLGFRRDSVLLVTLDPRNSGYSREQLRTLYTQLLIRFEGMRGVRSTTLSAVTPIEGPGWARHAQVEGVAEAPEQRRYISLNGVAPKYFQTFGTPLLAGRDFQFEDARGPRVAIVNQAFARHYFGDATPLGRRVSFDRDPTLYEIVGVAADSKYSELHEPMPRTVYVNAFQEDRAPFSQFALRTSIPAASVVNDVRKTVDEVLKTVPIAKMTTLADQVDAAMRPERTVATLSGLFGAVGVLLAAIGLYGLLSYTVSQRVNEIGIRMALGATRRDVTRLVVATTLRLVCAGLVIGAPIAIASRPLAARFVLDLTSSAIGPMTVAAAMMVGVAMLAAYLPARRAARVDPLEALRHE